MRFQRVVIQYTPGQPPLEQETETMTAQWLPLQSHPPDINNLYPETRIYIPLSFSKDFTVSVYSPKSNIIQLCLFLTFFYSEHITAWILL